MGDLLFRSATADDVEAIIEFWLVAAEDSHRPPDSVEAVRQLIVRDPDALMLAIEADELVGSVLVGWDGWRCHIYRLAVRPSHRRRGIGLALLGAADRRARARGATRTDAMVLDDNVLGHTIWHRAGYKRQREWSRWVKPVDP